MPETPLEGGEYIGLTAVVEQYPFAYSSLRAWVKAGLVPAYRTPNGRVFLRRSDIETRLLQRIKIGDELNGLHQ